MREQQPEALRLAERLDWADTRDLSSLALRIKAAAELRRLSNINYELFEALRWIADRCPAHLMDQPLHSIHKEMAFDAGSCARYALTETEKQAHA